MLDEQQLLIHANSKTATDAETATAKAAATREAAYAALDGRRIEAEQALEKRARLQQQRARRATDGLAEKREHVSRFFKSSSKSSVDGAVATYVRVANEDTFLIDVLKLSDQEIEAAQSHVLEAEIAAMKADLQHQESSVISLAIAHLAAVAHVTATDPDLEIPFGPAIVSSLDRIAETVTQIAKKERGN